MTSRVKRVATKSSTKDSADLDGGLKLIVGLGNPGSKYDQTRHNAGFWFVDELARSYQGDFKPEKKLSADVCKVNIASQAVWLQKPQTFMNLSGRAVQKICTFYKIKPQQVLVAHDEIDLPVDKIKLKKAGGHGGHNGLRDIIARIGSRDFWRLRVGIGHPGHKSAVTGYVLKRAPADEQRLIDEVNDLLVGEMERLVGGDLNAATKVIHSHKPPIQQE